MSQRVLICGSRDWLEPDAIRARIFELGAGDMVITGGARGADLVVETHARELGHHVCVVRPLWDHFGKRAGIVRNEAMLDLEPDLVIAFHQNDSPGTRYTITEARKRGIEVEVYAFTPAKTTA